MNVAEYGASYAAMRDRARYYREQDALASLRRFFAHEAAVHAMGPVVAVPRGAERYDLYPQTIADQHGMTYAVGTPVRSDADAGLVVADLLDDRNDGDIRREGGLRFRAPTLDDFRDDRASRDVQARARLAYWLEGVESAAAAPERPAEELLKLDRRKIALMAQSLAMARKMESAGACMFPPNRLKIGIYDPIPDTVDILPGMRRLNILPAIAAQRRSCMVTEAEYFLAGVNPQSVELHTFTAGRRTLTSMLRAKYLACSRKLGQMTRQRWYKAVAEMVWRGVEVGGLLLNKWSAADYNRRHGIPEQTKAVGLDGAVRWVDNPAAYQSGMPNPEAWLVEADRPGRQPLWHVHAHCLVIFRPGVTEAQKTAFWARCRAYWRHVCDRGAREDGSTHVENIREAIKYPAKPAELEALNGGQLIELTEALSRLKIVLPRGGLRRFRSECHWTVQKPARRIGPTGEMRLVLGPDHNSKRSPAVRACVWPIDATLPVRRQTAAVWVDSVTGQQVNRYRKPANRTTVPAPEVGEDLRGFLMRSIGQRPVETDRLTARGAEKIAATPIPDRSTDAARPEDDEPAKPITNRVLAKFIGPDSRPRFVVFNPVDRSALAARAVVSRTVRAYTRARDAHASAPRAPRARLMGVHNRHSTCTPLGLAEVPGVAPDPKTPPDPAARLRIWAETAA